MMFSLQRLGDRNTRGGVCVGGDSSVLVNGKPVAIPSQPVTAHVPCGKPSCASCKKHCFAVTRKTSPVGRNVLVRGRPVIVLGDIDSCGDARVGGSPNVKVGL